MQIRDPGSFQPWIRDGKNRIRDPGYVSQSVRFYVSHRTEFALCELKESNVDTAPCIHSTDVDPWVGGGGGGGWGRGGD
jgi:hypothetical protein